jgi:uncharacterized protein YhfF
MYISKWISYNMDQQNIDTYWQQFLATHPDTPPDTVFIAERFGDSPELADELAALIIDGTKTATCSALWEWEFESEPLPEIGTLTILLNGDDEPLCVIETTEVTIRPYNEVDAQFASEEGEGNRSLDYWRDAHWKFFSRVLPAIDQTPTQDMPLVCERFKVIYR